jgi:serine/threonine protein kinase
VEIAEALQAAHSKGIIHRGLKPSIMKAARNEHIAVVQDFFAAGKKPVGGEGPCHNQQTTQVDSL